MSKALVLRRNHLPRSQTKFRAAQYVRMSTDHQRYSIENQAAVIAAYAQAHNLAITRTYSDKGESGLRIKNRPGLIELIQDVRHGRANFGHILVFDVSRWGRFQDIDESAHYEFICRRAGVKVAYCAEQFDNNGSLISSIVKNLKRVMAAEFSRELSVKVHAGACRLSSLGFKIGGAVGYGLRRELVDESSRSKGFLKRGDRKYLQTDHVRLKPGPSDEANVVRWIFHQFVEEHRSETAIARQLNRDGVPNKIGQPWNRRLIGMLLRNENYIGNLLYNRRSCRLGHRAVENPPHLWIRSEGAIEPIIEPALFYRARKIIEERRVCVSKDEMLRRLRKTLHKNGRLTARIINDTVGLPSAATYMENFNTLRKAYKLIGYQPKRDCDWIDSHHRWSEVVASLSNQVAAAIKDTGGRVDMNSAADCMLVNRAVGISFRIARCWLGKKESHAPRWAFHRRRHIPPGWFVVIRLTKGHSAVLDYLLLPSTEVTMPMVKFTEQARSRYKCERFGTADALVKAVVKNVTIGGRAFPTRSTLSKRPRTNIQSRRKNVRAPR